MSASAIIQNMKNNNPTYYQRNKQKRLSIHTLRLSLLWVALWLVTTAAFAQKSNKRYTEADILSEAQFIEADALFLLGKYPDAVTKFKEFLKEYPNVAVAHFQLGRTYEVMKETEKSLAEIEKAVSIDGKNRWFLIKQAAIFEANGQADKAAQVMVRLTKIYPKSDFAYKKAAFYYLLSQNPNKAIDILNKGEKRVGFDPEFCHRKHVIFLAQGKTKEAIKELKKIIKHYPKSTKYHLQLAETYLTIGKPTLAEQEYRTILTYDPYNADALVGLQKRNTSIGDADNQALMKMVANPNISIDLKITEIVPIINKASPKSPDTKKQEWSQIVEKLIQTHPNDAKAYSVAADMYYAIGQDDKALANYQKTLAREKSVFPVWQQTLELLFAKKDYPNVILTARQALNFFPNKSKIMLYLAEAEFRASKTHKAISDYQQAAMMSGRNRHQKRFIYGRLAEIYLFDKNPQKARKYLDKALQLDDAKDPFIKHVEDEVNNNKSTLYGAWLRLYPFGRLLQ